jgi:hypothetical protein
METTKPTPRQTAAVDAPTPTQDEADAFKLQAHGASEGDVPPVNVDVPHVSGTGAVGATLSCTMGNWEGEPTSYAYQWLGGTSTLGTGETYTVGESDVGASITCVVTATNAFGSTTAPPSNAIDVAAAARAAAPEKPRAEPRGERR